MNQRFPLFLRSASIALICLPALSAQAAGPLAIPNGVIQSNAAAAGTSFNSLSAEDRKKLLAAPETDFPSNATGNGMNLKDDRHCIELQQQIKRAQTSAPAGVPDSYPQGIARNDPNRPYQASGGNVLVYDERSKLEARYHSECNK
ncbi:hypothetical protein LT85_1508 [Collimonas arenae]|uniref:Uncharacterized protein n=1 Tax=Collimonas arenae TaxID=279058 RepID=A0A0A1F829_9BURK|nr:hypothetical protein [Collimonas arenae]AIY40666.1 hypothetical protein LT85_1508 [Collimonas arenae]